MILMAVLTTFVVILYTHTDVAYGTVVEWLYVLYGWMAVMDYLSPAS